MKKRLLGIFVCVVLLFAAVVLTACANETEALQAQIDALENEKTELQSTISSLQTDLETARSDLSRTRSELFDILASLEPDDDDDGPASPQNTHNEPLAITYGGEPNKDMSWEYKADLDLGLIINYNALDIDEGVEIVWHSTNEAIFTVVASEDGTSATVTPVASGSAQLVVTVGDHETSSWVRITW